MQMDRMKTDRQTVVYSSILFILAQSRIKILLHILTVATLSICFNLKGVRHELFNFMFFMNLFSTDPFGSIGPLSNCYENLRRHSQLCVYRWCQ
jgi:hypothetical protein